MIAVKKKPKPEHKRRKMAHVTEEMKEWSAMLQQEIEKWPKVAAKPMFGMRNCRAFGSVGYFATSSGRGV